MMYEEHLRASETGAWSLDQDIRWRDIDSGIAAREADIHAALYDAALIEGYLPVFGPRMMQLLWDDIDATAILSLEMYEGLKHYTALRRYLETVGHTSRAASQSALVAARAKAKDISYRVEDIVSLLTHFMCSELFAAHFFTQLSERTQEPVLRELLTYMSRDELRHSAGAGALLKKRIDANPRTVDEVLAAAENFRHYGSDVVQVPVAEANDFDAVMAMNRKVRQVCGLAPTEHLRQELIHE
jgi:hypothetical protein